MIKNFRLTTDYDGEVVSHQIFEPYRVDARTVGMIDSDIRIQGTFIGAQTTVFNWHMENILIETMYLDKFSALRLSCGEDGTTLGTRTYLKNVTSINSGTKPAYLHGLESFIRNYVSHNVHVEDCSFDSYLGYGMGIAQYIFYQDPTGCTDAEPAAWNFTNIYGHTTRLEAGKDETMVGTNTWVFSRILPYEKPMSIYVRNFTLEHDLNKINGHFIAWLAYNVTYEIDGINLVNSGGYGLRFHNVYQAELQNVVFDQYIADWSFACFTLAENGFSIDGMTINGMIHEGTYESSLFDINLYQPSDFVLNNVNIYNSTFTNRKAVFFPTGEVGSTFSSENITVEDVSFDTEMHLIAYGVFDEVNITGVSVTRANTLSDVSNYIITSDTSEGSAVDNIVIIKDIMATESTVPMLSISRPELTPGSTQSITIQNIKYLNCDTSYGFEIFRIFRISTVETYSITIEDVEFRNLTFGKETQLMYFQQQLSTPLTLTNVNISDVVLAGINVEISDPNDAYAYSHVKIENMKATNVNGHTRSLININTGADIEIIDSEFSFIGNYDKGAVLAAGYDKAVATLRN